MTAGNWLALTMLVVITVAVAIIMRSPPATEEEHDDMREDWDR
jgi:hypothetical protein